MSEAETSNDQKFTPEAIREAGALHGLLRLRRRLALIQAEVHLLSFDAQSAFQEIVETFRDVLSLDSLGRELPAGADSKAWPAARILHVLWSGGDERAIRPLLAGLSEYGGLPRITLTSDLTGALAQLKRQLPDLWVVTPKSQAELAGVHKLVAELDAPPVVVVLASTLEPGLPQGHRGGVIEYVSERELTSETLRERATRALVRGRFIKDLSEAHQRVEDLVHRDALTGLYNRRYFESRLAIEFARATRFGEALTLVLIDVDHFKEVNDTHGHPAGDQVLVQTGQLLLAAVRSIDLVARVGGEEFALLLPNTGATGAPGLVQRIIDRVRQHRFGNDTSLIHVTLSAGIAACPRHGCAQERALYDHADQALYLAKRRGRDRLEVYLPAGE